MKIFDKEFAFSSLNANDIERLEQAKAKLEKAEEAERQRAQQTTNMSYAEGIRGQCRIAEAFVDDVLGEGSAAALGLDGNDLGKALTVMTELTRAANQEKQKFDPSLLAPQLNREQRRKAKRRRHHG